MKTTPEKIAELRRLWDDKGWLCIPQADLKPLMRQALPDLLDDVEEALRLREENEELNALFDIQHKRMMEAIKIWQQETGNELTHPDLGMLLEWLMRKAGLKK